MPVIIHLSLLSSFFSSVLKILTESVGRLHFSFTALDCVLGEAVVTVFRSYIRVACMFICLASTCFAFLIQIILVARRGEHRRILPLELNGTLAVRWI